MDEEKKVETENPSEMCRVCGQESWGDHKHCGFCDDKRRLRYVTEFVNHLKTACDESKVLGGDILELFQCDGCKRITAKK